MSLALYFLLTVDAAQRLARSVVPHGAIARMAASGTSQPETRRVMRRTDPIKLAPHQQAEQQHPHEEHPQMYKEAECEPECDREHATQACAPMRSRAALLAVVAPCCLPRLTDIMMTGTSLAGSAIASSQADITTSGARSKTRVSRPLPVVVATTRANATPAVTERGPFCVTRRNAANTGATTGIGGFSAKLIRAAVAGSALIDGLKTYEIWPFSDL